VLSHSLSPARGSRASGSLDDEQLMLRVQVGDTAAFAALYDRHAPAVYRLAHRIVRSRAIAEDVTQETFVGFWRGRAEYSGERGAVRGWLLAIGRNRAIDVTRRPSHHRDRPLEADFDQESTDCTEGEVLRRADASAIAIAMAGLPDDQRTVVDLAFNRGLTQAEIAHQLALPLGTVKSRSRLGLNKLRGELAEWAAALESV
jgi:RNA polymerase sigma-70 factor (ECF subfamily)